MTASYCDLSGCIHMMTAGRNVLDPSVLRVYPNQLRLRRVFRRLRDESSVHNVPAGQHDSVDAARQPCSTQYVDTGPAPPAAVRQAIQTPMSDCSQSRASLVTSSAVRATSAACTEAVSSHSARSARSAPLFGDIIPFMFAPSV